MEKARTFDLRPVLVLAAAVFAAAAVWATTALAEAAAPRPRAAPRAGSPAALFVQDAQPPAREDCPERDGSGVVTGTTVPAAARAATWAAPAMPRPSDPPLRRGPRRRAAPSIKIGAVKIETPGRHACTCVCGTVRGPRSCSGTGQAAAWPRPTSSPRPARRRTWPRRRARRAAVPRRRAAVARARAPPRRGLDGRTRGSARRRRRGAVARRRWPLAGARVSCRTTEATGATAVLCLAFPLRPPRRTGPPAASRLPELDVVTVPTLVVQGERDPFGIPPRRSAALSFRSRRPLASCLGRRGRRGARLAPWRRRGLDANMRSCPPRPRFCTPTSTRSTRRSSSATTRGSVASP